MTARASSTVSPEGAGNAGHVDRAGTAGRIRPGPVEAGRPVRPGRPRPAERGQAEYHQAGRWRVARGLLGALLSLFTAVAFAPAFGRTSIEALTDARYALPVAGAVAVVASVCLLLAAGTKVFPVTRVMIALGGLAGFVVLAVAPGREVAGGPKRLFTSALPLETGGPELAAVVVFVGLTTLAAIEPALRRPAAALPLLGPLAGTALGSAVSAGVGPPAPWLAPALVSGSVAMLLLARYQPGPRRAVVADRAGARPASRLRRRLAAGLFGTLVVGAVISAGGYGPGLLTRSGRDAPLDARTLVPQPVQPREATSPLVLFPALLHGKVALSLTVRTQTRPSLLRYVSLEEFDGEHWSTSARYRRAGRRLPVARGEQRPVSYRDERVSVGNAGPLGWLVASGRPVEVSTPGLGVDENTGDVVLPADRPVPAAYTVRSAVPAAPDPGVLQTAKASPAGARGAQYPAWVTELARRIASNEIDYRALRRLVAYFRPADAAAQDRAPGPDFRVDQTAKAPGGHGLHHINRLLLKNPRGTAEQFASAFAVLTRALGYRSRVVMGFRAPPGQSGEYRITEKNVHAWVEVHFEGVGWVHFDPTPTRSTTDPNQAPAPPLPTPQPRPDDRDKRDPPPRIPPPRALPPPAPDRTGPIAAAALAAMAGLAVAYVGGVPVAKARRRARRRRRGDPNRRTLAAWRETLDRLVEIGLDVAAADTTGEAVAATRTRLGAGIGESMARLAELHDLAVFASAAVPEAAAGEAWRHADRVRTEIKTGLKPPARLRIALDPRPLRRAPGHPKGDRRRGARRARPAAISARQEL
jgi:hypothetical protein